ncbi:MAG: GC-type dockerin domain-anchored protein [Phycisphaerales bacterium]|nr:GC-type dockerin domain-anchored protein [Phycisphaerales bacterium]
MTRSAQPIRRGAIAGLLAAVCVALAAAANAAPVVGPWPAPTGVGEKQVAAAGLGGLWATSDGATIEVRDVRQQLRLSRSLADVAPLISGLNTATARFGRLCFSESGRLLFVVVRRPVAGNPSVARYDDIVRMDVETGAMSLFASTAVAPARASSASDAMVHWGGRLYAASVGGVSVRSAQRNQLTGTSQGDVQTQAGVEVVAITIDRVGGLLLAVDANGVLFRAAPTPGVATPIGNVGTGVVSIAFSEHFGGPANGGLYVGNADGRVRFVAAASVRGNPPAASVDYTTGPGPQSVAAGADGSLLIGDTTGVRRVTDTTDVRLGFEHWLEDEVRQQVAFAKGLISPQGEPAGWVIDGEVAVGGTLFHPATPDGAAWVVLMLTTADELFGDPDARPLVRTVLKRYAGQASGPAPTRNANGIYRHWIDPFTGGAKNGWDPEFATMSTMKIVAAAARAGEHFSQDAQIVSAARQICCTVNNWDGYVIPNGRFMLLKGLAGGPDSNSWSQPFHEGLIFMQQAAFYGTTDTALTYNSWLNRATMPSASFINGRSVAGTFGGFGPAFISVYPALLVDDYRAQSDWRQQVANVSSSAAAWTDDNAPRWFTVFSAGTTKPEWGGYHADAINNSPGNVATFTALCGLAGRADGLGVREATAAYHAYRTGARQSFRSGASLLYRRSNVDPSWLPPDAGLPDVSMGGLGLAELLSPGLIDRLLARGLPVCGACTADVGRQGGVTGPDGLLDNNDFIVFINAFFNGDRLIADVGMQGGVSGGDGVLDNNDFIAFIDAFFAGCQP